MFSKNNPLLPENYQIVAEREIIRNHLDTVCSIENDTFHPPWTRIDFVNELESDNASGMVLLHNNRCIGYLFSKMAFSELHINKMCIQQRYRDKGFGKLLVQNFIETMQLHCERMFLEVDSTNTNAIHLYTSCGFTVNRIRKAIYENGANAIEMVRSTR